LCDIRHSDFKEKMKISVATAVAKFLSSKGSNAAFVVAGGASLHLIHAFAREPGCDVYPLHHEQSVAMAVDGFSRSSNSVGVGIVTSGPGSTNLATGIAGCFYDSVPAIFVTGQVSTFRRAGKSGVRQFGFQETPIAEILSPICKEVVQILEPSGLREKLEFAYFAATSGRQGPVVIEIPDNLQREIIEWDSKVKPRPSLSPAPNLDGDYADRFFQMLNQAHRPVVIGGAGLIRSQAEQAFKRFVERAGIPVALTWGAASALETGHPNFVGFFGTHGDRHGNLVVQNSDLVISIGSRLDTKATGSPITSFAREARKIVIDIDPLELEKFSHFGMEVDLAICSDALAFLELVGNRETQKIDSDWLGYCAQTKQECEKIEHENRVGRGVNPYSTVALLSELGPRELDIYVDTGCSLPYVMSSFSVNEQRRIFHDFNNTAMGWSLPATLGGFVGAPHMATVTIIGDGSLMMALHDLTTFAALNPAAKIVLLDNSGYSMIRQTQDQWLGSQYVASSPELGLHFPDYSMLAKSAGFSYLDLEEQQDSSELVRRFWQEESPVLLRLSIDPSWRVIPQVKFGSPNEEMEPSLKEEVFSRLMLVPRAEKAK